MADRDDPSWAGVRPSVAIKEALVIPVETKIELPIEWPPAAPLLVWELSALSGYCREDCKRFLKPIEPEPEIVLVSEHGQFLLF
jgi:hypothetical protein